MQQSLSQNGTTVASYNWLADGTKCGVVDNSGNGYDYTGSLIYSRSGSTRTLESIENGVGRIYYSGGTFNPFYYLTDHLGSTRAISNSSGTVVERNDYYPFGGQHGNSSYPQLAGNRFKYNGKELQTTGNTRYLDYGARMYDDVIGRWGVVDPMAEDDFENNPYNYGLNNPIRFIDPNGMQAKDSTLERTLPSVTVTADRISNNERFERLIYNLINRIVYYTGGPLSKLHGNNDATFFENFQETVNFYFLVYAPFQLFLNSNGVSSSRTGNNVKSVASKGGAKLWPAASMGRIVINGIEYTEHALARMQPVGTIMKGKGVFSRGIPPSVVENVIKFGKVTKGNTTAEVVRTFENVRIITNPQGTRVISVIKIGN